MSIGRECIVADRVMLIDFDHGVVEVDRPIREQGIYKRDVRVGHNVWIGYGAAFLRGVTVGDNSVIGTYAVVTQRRARQRGRGRRAGARHPDARHATADALVVTDDQLRFDVDPTVLVTVTERRGENERTLRLGPLGEPEARELATFLLNRGDAPPADGPWRVAVAGGVRVVALTRLEPRR